MVNSVVALDLGTTHIRGIEAQIKNGSLPKIMRIHSIPVESEIIVSGLIENETALQGALKKLWTEGKFTSKNVVTMATGDSYDNRVVPDIPWSPPNDFKRLLPHYLREKLPFDIEDYYFDAHTLNEYYKDSVGDNQLYKLIYATGVHRQFADTLIRSLEVAGLRPVGMDIMPLALIRAYASTSEAPESATVVSIELGGDITTIVIHKNSQPVYTNTATPLGGERISAEIAQELQLTLPEADMIKVAFSKTPEEQSQMVATNFYQDGTARQTRYVDIPEQQKQDALQIVSREVSNIITHIGDILEDASGSRIETPFEMVLSGGGASLHTLVPRLQSELGIPTRIAQPFGDETSGKVDPEIFQNQHVFNSIFGLLVGQNEL